MKNYFLLLALPWLLCSFLQAQNIEQNIRGSLIDTESKVPLIGANVTVMTTDPIKGTTTDLDGNFIIENIPIGRHDIEISYLGYEPIFLSSIMLSSAKELVLNLEMEESTQMLETVEISAEKNIDKTKPLNTFATVSSRTFSVEETSRYAAAVFDPTRMAMNYAGVSLGAGGDLYNEIVVRGNAPTGITYRLEGIEIANPNHFGSLGGAGGAISMLSSTTLSNSDFYTGAFPAEIGNATAAVFDLNLRNGNNQKRESSFMIGALGLEFGTEGPFSKKSKASYVVNYRYSTLALLEAAGINPAGDVLPIYQDLSFKVNIPTKELGTFALFGLGGDNLAAARASKDSLDWGSQSDRESWSEVGRVGTLGLTHRKLIGDNSYVRTAVALSQHDIDYNESFLRDDLSDFIYYDERMSEKTLRISSLFHQKVNQKLSYRVGGVYSDKSFDFLSKSKDTLDAPFVQNFIADGSTGFVQLFGQAKWKLSENVKVNTGVHFSQIVSNNKFTVEPRLAVNYRLKRGRELNFSVGLHSRMEHLSLYSLNGKFNDGSIARGNDQLAPTKSIHSVVGYDHIFSPDLRLKVEAYYQYLYDVLVLDDPNSTFSILNTRNIWGYFGLNNAVQEGSGRNYGLDVTFEKFLSQSYYFMVTGSVYDSQYKTLTDKWYSTRYNGRYQLNLVGGKEFVVGKKKKNILGINSKLLLAGGNRYTPIDFETSKSLQDEVRFEDRAFEDQVDAYFRADIGISYKINTPKMTHTIMFDIQNFTNRQNVYGLWFNNESLEIEKEYNTGLFPFFNYRIEF